MRAPERFVVHPSHAAAQEHRRQASQAEINAFVETLHADPPPQGPELHIVCGASRNLFLARDQYVRLCSLPLPEQYLGRLLATGRQVVVHEHGDPYVAEKIEAMLATRAVTRVCLNNNDRFRWKHHCRSDWETLFGVLRSFPGRLVCGDLGGFTMDPPKTLDACLCYGASVAVGMGASLAGAGPVFVVTGDAAFLHSGKSVLAEAVARHAALTVIVFDNGGARGTGGQPIPGCLQAVPDGVTLHQLDYDNTSAEQWRSLLRAGTGVNVIIARTSF